MLTLPRFDTALTLALLLLLAVLVTVLLRPTPRTTPGACTHYAAPQGTGSACTEAAPCLVSTWTQSASLARPGATLCLLDGTYRRSQGGSIDPLDTLAGTASQPITVRALHDGQVLLDAEHSGFAVFLQVGNDYWHIEGLNATNGKEAVFRVKGSHTRGRRLIGWNGTPGEADSIIFNIGYGGTDNRIEDCAGWGTHSRKIFSGAQDGDAQGGGFRRCWGEWNGHPLGESQPANTYQGGYNTTNQRFENILGTWNTTGEVTDAEGILRFFTGAPAEPNDIGGSKVLGSLFYVAPGARYAPSVVVTTDGISGLTMEDVVALLAPGHATVKPFFFMDSGCTSSDPCTGNVCQRCLAVHAGTPSVNEPAAGWSLPGFREGRTLAEATGGVSPFTLLPGLCRRYEGGVLTDQPLWPWPMEGRIKAARAQAGVPVVDVTATVEALLGPIPAACKTSPQPPEPEPVPPGPVALTCRGRVEAVPGTVTLDCTPTEGRR